eukprot:scaffold18729_cov119-Skeletonema_dohrnii-CCMP3373.AAC.1
MKKPSYFSGTFVIYSAAVTIHTETIILRMPPLKTPVVTTLSTSDDILRDRRVSVCRRLCYVSINVSGTTAYETPTPSKMDSPGAWCCCNRVTGGAHPQEGLCHKWDSSTEESPSALVLSPSSDSDRCLKVLLRVGGAPMRPEN